MYSVISPCLHARERRGLDRVAEKLLVAIDRDEGVTAGKDDRGADPRVANPALAWRLFAGRAAVQRCARVHHGDRRELVRGERAGLVKEYGVDLPRKRHAVPIEKAPAVISSPRRDHRSTSPRL